MQMGVSHKLGGAEGKKRENIWRPIKVLNVRDLVLQICSCFILLRAHQYELPQAFGCWLISVRGKNPQDIWGGGESGMKQNLVYLFS